jgi:hypothetical protein
MRGASPYRKKLGITDSGVSDTVLPGAVEADQASRLLEKSNFKAFLSIANFAPRRTHLRCRAAKNCE